MRWKVVTPSKVNGVKKYIFHELALVGCRLYSRVFSRGGNTSLDTITHLTEIMAVDSSLILLPVGLELLTTSLAQVDSRCSTIAKMYFDSR